VDKNDTAKQHLGKLVAKAIESDVAQRVIEAVEAEVGEPVDFAFLKINDVQFDGSDLSIDYDYDLPAPLKQVIVVRKDLKMRKGEMCVQASHASIGSIVSTRSFDTDSHSTQAYLSPEEDRWLGEGMAKVCVRVGSEDELDEIYQQSLDAKVNAYMVVDEYDGVPTKTCLAIGPDRVEAIDEITDHLKLL